MYVPEAFAESRLPVLHNAIDGCGLAIFVTCSPDGPVATHVPMLLARDEGEFGTLHFHLARANGQWRGAARALAIFPGPDGYVSPAWYASKAEHGRVVPTWNYVVVHAAGTAEIYEDADRLRGLVSRLTERHEARRATPWAVSDAPAAYIESQLRAIVGVRLPIADLQGKWKLGQNRPAADRAGMLAGYDAAGTAAYQALAAATRG
ncbi:MAG TPA: FMN-binding negative transcriptional regulator [Acetobacteraceae bacterium]|nr:FMN-binding negative transcriptional regulator [Acetobacteraceae bacterium]